MRLIDADALMSAVMAQDVVDKSVAKRLIIQAQTVDAVQVVRCQDCNKSKEWPNGRWCGLFRASVNTDSYCSFGAKRKERREDDGND